MQKILNSIFVKHKDFHEYCKSVGMSISQKTISSMLKWERGKFQEWKVLGFANAQIEKIKSAVAEYKKFSS